MFPNHHSPESPLINLWCDHTVVSSGFLSLLVPTVPRIGEKLAVIDHKVVTDAHCMGFFVLFCFSVPLPELAI